MKRYRRNSRKNPWRNSLAEKHIQKDVFFARLLLISIPLMIVCISANITLRMSNTYQYSLTSSQILNVAPYSVDQTKLVDLFGQYMQHRTDSFALKESVDYDPQDVFTVKDKVAMHHLRVMTDALLLVGIAALLVTALSYFMLIRMRRKVIHMEYFKKSFIIFLVLAAVSALVKVVPPLRALTWGRFFQLNHDGSDLLALIFDHGFYTQVTIFDLIISFVLMAILAYFTWEVAGRKKMFRRR
ncbi:MAG: DUF1461 domain-containing protein [Anaerovoracaceae bacterium]|jgi:hypothetical protein